MARNAGDGYLLKPHCRRRCLRKLDDHLTCAGRLRWSRRRLLALVVALALLVLLWRLWFYCRRDWSKDTWVTLAPSRLHIYSAWAERRGPVHGVRVVAMLASGGALRGRLLCTLAYTNYSHVQVVAARTEPLWGTGNTLDPGYVLCSGDPQLEADEVGLRLVDTVRVHWLPVTHAWKERSNGGNGAGDGSLAACVLSRTGTVSDLKLAEFVAHYLLLGVGHFLFYNQTETRQARHFLDAVAAVNYFDAQYLSWSRSDARDLLPYECALRMRHKVSVLLVVEMNELLILDPAGRGWRPADTGRQLVNLPCKDFCRDGDGARGLRLSRSKRLKEMGKSRLVVAHLETLLGGSVKATDGDQGVLHRYTDKECDPSSSQLDTSAAGVETQVRASQAVIQWNVLFGS